MPKKTIGLVVAISLAIISQQASGASALNSRSFWEKSGYFAANIGFIGTGKLRIDGAHINTQPGFTFGAKFDFRFSRNLYWGLSADVHRLHVRDTGQYFLDLSCNVKKMYFGRSSRVGLRPGIGVGFGHLTHFRDLESSTFLMTRITFEAIFFSETRVGWIIEVGLIAAPTGGNREHDMTYGPVPLFRVGAMF
jgi:hypothetical protein